MNVFKAQIWVEATTPYSDFHPHNQWEGYFLTPDLAEDAIAVQQAKIALEWNTENEVEVGQYLYAANIIKIWVEDGTQNPDPFHQKAKVM